MRRKQLYAIMLAGALAVGSTPASVFAEEGVVAAAETEGAPIEETGESAPAEESTPAPEAPAESTPAAEAPAEESTPAPEAPAESAPATETPVAETPSESTPTPTVEAVPEAAKVETKTLLPGESETDTGISVTVAGAEGEEPAVHYFESIQAAVDAVTDSASTTVPVIKLTKDIAVNAAVELKDGKRVCITAVSAVKLTRAEGFTGNLFAVSGMDASTGTTGSELQLKVEGEGASLTLDGAGADGSSLISVGESGAFGMFDGVTLTNNKTTDNGGAITNDGGRIILAGGTITANTGAKGGIYSNTAVCVQGNIVISENKSVNTEGQETVSNLYVEVTDGTAAVKVTDTLGDSASVGYTDAAPADNKVVIEAGTKGDGTALSAEEFKNAVGKMAYDDSAKFTINLAENALQATLKAVEEVIEPSEPSKPSEPEKPSESTFKLEAGKVEWIGYTKAKISFTASEDCEFYATYGSNITNEYDPKKEVRKAYAGQVKSITASMPASYNAIVIHAKSISGEVQTCKIELKNRPAFKISQEGNDSWSSYKKLKSVKFKATHDCEYYWKIIGANESVDDLKFDDKITTKKSAKVNETVSIKDIEIPEGDKALVILAKSTGNSEVKRIKITFKNRPAKPSRENFKYSVTDNKVSGLENELKFFPSKEYEFTVTEAGMDNQSVIAGDERYVFLYWSMSKSGSNPNTKTKILSQKGISEANTYNMYLFFQKYIYGNDGWEKEGSPEYLTTQFYSAGYTEEELEEYLNQAKEEGTEIPGYENYTGSGEGDTEAELTEAASEKDTGATFKSAVSTADESPIGTMSALAMLSLLAGGYILVRKRKKEEI